MCVLFTGISTVNAQTKVYDDTKNDFGIGIYGDINMDIFYSYGTNDNTINKAAVFKSGHHSFGTQSFLDDSFFGIDLTYKNLALQFELGISDYVRKYVLTYNFQDKYNQFISIGRDNTLAYYQMGQVLNGYQGLTNFGALNSDNRRLQVRYGIENFEAALIFPYLGPAYEPANDNAFFARNFNKAFLGFAAIPRLEAAYYYDYKNLLSLKAFASYGVTVYAQEHTYKKDDVHTASLGAGGKTGDFVEKPDNSHAYLSNIYADGNKIFTADVNSSNTIEYTANSYIELQISVGQGEEGCYHITAGGNCSDGNSVNAGDGNIRITPM